MAKKKSPVKGKTKTVNTVQSAFGYFKEACATWTTARDKSVQIVEKVVELRIASTYSTGPQLNEAVGFLGLRPSRVNVLQETELLARLRQLEYQQGLMLEAVRRMGALWNGFADGGVGEMNAEGEEEGDACTMTSSLTQASAGDSKLGDEAAGTEEQWPVDAAFTSAVVEQMTQQTLLEVTIFEQLQGSVANAAFTTATTGAAGTCTVARLAAQRGTAVKP
jgi:hypothetical protein